MFFSSLALILIAITTAGYTNGASLNEHCNDKYICLDKPMNYDSFKNDIDKYVNESKNFLSKVYTPPVDDGFDARLTGDDENCWAITTTEKPFVILTNGSVEYVVQSESFEQKIRVTKCHGKTSSTCFQSVKTLSNRATCEENLGPASLYVYYPEVREIQYKMIQVPIGCSCKLHND